VGFPRGGDHAVVAGRQGVSSSRGQASSEPVVVLQETQGDKQCNGSGYFQLAASPHALRPCRYALDRTVDRATVHRYQGGAARVRVYTLNTSAPVELLDSYANVIGTIQMKYKGCFHVAATGQAGFDTVDTNLYGSSATCDDVDGVAQMQIEVNGPGCMATSAPTITGIPGDTAAERRNASYQRILLREPKGSGLQPRGAALMWFVRATEGPAKTRPTGSQWSLTPASPYAGRVVQPDVHERRWRLQSGVVSGCRLVPEFEQGQGQIRDL
jgi:hypothetical protein